MKDTNYSFASLFDKSIPLDCEITVEEINKLIQNHKIAYPREESEPKPSKVKFGSYLKSLGMPKWEVEIFRELRDVSPYPY